MHVRTFGQSVRAYVCTIVQACVRIFVQCIYACVRTLGQADGSSREDFAAASEQQLLSQRDYRNATTSC